MTHEPTPNPNIPPYKQLRRPVDDRMIAGVCSGLARYANMDPNAVRVLFALVAILTWGVGALAYPVMWFIMPEDRGPAWPGATGSTGAGGPLSPPRP
jgi:phage shock protein C